jgi:glc operon protein GlcG
MATSETPELVTMHPQMTLHAARLVLKKALSEARSRQRRVSVAVVDLSGELLAFERDDDSAGVTVNTAIAKAKTAALLRDPSSLFETFINQGSLSFLATPGITPLQGGVPVMLDGRLIGAVGVSGASGEEDNAIATQAAICFMEQGVHHG